MQVDLLNSEQSIDPVGILADQEDLIALDRLDVIHARRLPPVGPPYLGRASLTWLQAGRRS